MPDIIILDEAQRIKNWQTKTAWTVKQLKSPYTFVLTGTPIENRIDEIYSITQMIDPHIFGPLFRFNRNFYELDEQGNPTGYKNLDKLHRTLRPVLLRRLKSEVEDELPQRTIKNYFVKMNDEQRTRYDEYSSLLAALLAKAKKRPLSKKEMDKVQKFLACMRMICDTPYILDPEYKRCPKLSELEMILQDVLSSPNNKVIIFSEWERMLSLIKELADSMNIGYAWHTGRLSQDKRRDEINRFKNDENCRLFLSTDSGSTGLNLQVANVVINMDLPWNPAKLEQRIARSWRKHQKQTVQVINLVCEDSIEHRMIYLLSEKQKLASSVIDKGSNIQSMPLPSGKNAFIERLESVMDCNIFHQKSESTIEKPKKDIQEDFKNDMKTHFHDSLQVLEVCQNEKGDDNVLIVMKKTNEQIEEKIKNISAEVEKSSSSKQKIHILDDKMLQILQELQQNGLIQINSEKLQKQTLYHSPFSKESKRSLMDQQIKKIQKELPEIERKINMAAVLSSGGFSVEALDPIKIALKSVIKVFSELKLFAYDQEVKEKGKDLFSQIDSQESDEEMAKQFVHLTKSYYEDFEKMINHVCLHTC